MISSVRVFAALMLATVALAAGTTAAPAQQPAATSAAAACEPDQSTPQFVGRATFSIQRALAALNADNDPSEDAKAAIRTLTDPQARDRNRNVAGQTYVLGQALAVLLSSPGIPTTGARADFGFASDPMTRSDLFVIADSVFKVIDASNPECAPVTALWRQNAAWIAVMNAALRTLGENKLDSAEALATRALILDTRAPYAHAVLGGVAKRRLAAAPAQDPSRAALATRAHEHLVRALEIARADTSYVDVVRTTLADLGELTAWQITSAAPAERAARVREAVGYFREYAASATEDAQRADAYARMADAYIIAGDTVGVRTIYAGVVADPTKFGERTLLESGIIATRYGAAADAARLYNAVLTENPYQRDALHNLAVTLVRLNDYPKLLEIAKRLTDLDPSNPDNWIFHAYAYAGMSEGSGVTAALRRVYTDSSQKYDRFATAMPVQVTFTEFSPLATESRLRGVIENRGTAERTYTLVVEFLDRTGKVIATEWTTVGPVAARASAEFSVLSGTGGVAAFRYKPV